MNTSDVHVDHGGIEETKRLGPPPATPDLTTHQSRAYEAFRPAGLLGPDDCPPRPATDLTTVEAQKLILALGLTKLGEYGYRLVRYWSDGKPHFGFPDSQPATHWHPLPSLPNT